VRFAYAALPFSCILLYSSDTRGRLGRTIVCSLGAGTIAVIGFAVGSRIEPLIRGHVPPPGQQFGIVTLIILSEAGVGALIGGMMGGQGRAFNVLD
jgi:hypothetical protein